MNYLLFQVKLILYSVDASRKKRENREISKLAYTKSYFAPRLLYILARQNELWGRGRESFDHFVLQITPRMSLIWLFEDLITVGSI